MDSKRISTLEFLSAGGVALVLNPGKDERPKRLNIARRKQKRSHKSLHLIRPSLSVSLGCPTQKVKKDPSELTLRVHTPIGYQPTWEVAMINDQNISRYYCHPSSPCWAPSQFCKLCSCLSSQTCKNNHQRVLRVKQMVYLTYWMWFLSLSSN